MKILVVFLFFCLSSATHIHVDLPWSMVCDYGSSFSITCSSNRTKNVWKRENSPNEPIFDGNFLTSKIPNKYLFADSTNKTLKVSFLTEDDGDVYHCTEEFELGRERRFYAVIIVSDHKNLICRTRVDGVLKHNGTYHDTTSQNTIISALAYEEIDVTCSFRLGTTRFCRSVGIWEPSVPGVKFKNYSEGGEIQLKYSAYGIPEVQNISFNLSVTFKCNLNDTDRYHLYGTQPLLLGYLYTTPTFVITPATTISTTTTTTTTTTTPTTFSPPNTSPFVSASTGKDPMKSILMVVMIVASLLIIIFFTSITVWLIRRKRARLETLGEYIHPMNTLSYSPSNVCMSENVAYRRNNIQENSYTPNTVTTTLSHEDLLSAMQPFSVGYQRLLPNEKRVDDYYDYIRESRMEVGDLIPEEDGRYDLIPVDKGGDGEGGDGFDNGGGSKGEKDGGVYDDNDEVNKKNGGTDKNHSDFNDDNDNSYQVNGGYGDFSDLGDGEKNEVYMVPDRDG